MFPAGRAKWLKMVAYEFYCRDATKGYELFGVSPERRKSPKRMKLPVHRAGFPGHVVASELNKGTSFFINLPLHQEHPKRRSEDFGNHRDIFNSFGRR